MASDVDFEQLVTRYYQPLYKFAFSLTRSEAEACDLAQETFHIWAAKGHQLKDASKVKQWLFTTLHREFLGARRRLDRFPHHELGLVEHELPRISPEAPIHVDTSMVLEALQEVSATYRAAVILFYMEDYSYKEIAEVLGVPMGTVQSRISRGLAHLQQIIRDRDRGSLSLTGKNQHG